MTLQSDVFLTLLFVNNQFMLKIILNILQGSVLV